MRGWIVTFLFLSQSISVAAQKDAATIVSYGQSEQWHKLLHFDSEKKISSVSDKKFFISDHGAVDPIAELNADIAALNGPQEIAVDFTCRFPARKTFIEKNLLIGKNIVCSPFEEWRARANPDSIKMVYASQYVSSPASAFGHSFLRFGRKDKPDLLSFALTFFASVNPDDNALVYALKGLTGRYLGKYQLDRYYPKVHGYSGAENREMWEYELNLNTEERQRLFEHAWELSLAGQEPYYFLDRNCTFQLLKLIEVAKPEIRLVEKLNPVFLTPVDSLKILENEKMLMTSSFRPSMQQKAQDLIENLKPDKKNEFQNILSGLKPIQSSSDTEVMDAMVATLAMNEIGQGSSQNPSSLFQQSTANRSFLPISSSNRQQIDISDHNPLKSHETMQASFGYFKTNNNSGLSLGFRPALHALTDLTDGYLPHSQIVLMESQFVLNQKNNLNLERLDFIQIQSLEPQTITNQKKSWAAELVYEQDRVSECQGCAKIRSAIQFGQSKRLSNVGIYYALAGLSLESLEPFQQTNWQMGPVLSAGSLFYKYKKTSAQIEASIDDYLIGSYESNAQLQMSMKASYHFDRSSNLGLDVSRAQNLERTEFISDELGLNYEYFF